MCFLVIMYMNVHEIPLLKTAFTVKILHKIYNAHSTMLGKKWK